MPNHCIALCYMAIKSTSMSGVSACFTLAFSLATSKETSAEVALAIASVSLGFSFVGGSLLSVFAHGFATIWVHTEQVMIMYSSYSII